MSKKKQKVEQDGDKIAETVYAVPEIIADSTGAKIEIRGYTLKQEKPEAASGEGGAIYPGVRLAGEKAEDLQAIGLAGEKMAAVEGKNVVDGIVALIKEADGGNQTRDIPPEGAPVSAPESTAVEEKSNVAESTEVKPPETITVDKKKFAKLMYSLVIGHPEAYLRFPGIRRFGELVGITEYPEQVKFWDEMKAFYNSGQ